MGNVILITFAALMAFAGVVMLLETRQVWRVARAACKAIAWEIYERIAEQDVKIIKGAEQ